MSNKKGIISSSISLISNVVNQGDSEDAKNVQSILAGDAVAFKSLVVKYKKRVFSLGMSFFHNESDTDDFVQDVFIKVFTGLKSFRGDSRFSTWLTRIAYNTAINAINRKKEYTSFTGEIDIIDEEQVPERIHLREVTKQVIKEAIDSLPQKYHVCLDMYFFYDMSYAEIAEVVNLPLNTVKSHVFRAKKILREKLKEV